MHIPRRRVPPLPESFKFGVALADHQTEAYDERYRDIWDRWEEELGLRPRGRATDFWNRYPEDIRLAKGLGCRLFRFSIAWARIEPEPGRFSDEAFEHYRQVLAAIREAGMEPVVTLHHFTWPLHVEERGGMLDEGFPELFRQYAREVARRLGDPVAYWITFNEPTLLPFGYIKFWWQRDYAMPPGLGDAPSGEQVGAVVRLMRNLFLAHARARHAIREIHPDARVGANPFVMGLPPWLQTLSDRKLTHYRREVDWARQELLATEPAVDGSGGADVVLAMFTVTPERERQVLFSQPYFLAPKALLVPAGSSVAGTADLADKTVLVVRGSSSEAVLPMLLPHSRVRRARDQVAALRALERGEATAFVSEESLLRRALTRFPDRYRLLEHRSPLQPYAAAVAQGQAELLARVDTALRQFKASGEWAASVRRHFPGQPPLDPPLLPPRRSCREEAGSGPDGTGLATAETRKGSAGLRRIRRRGKLVAAVREGVPGFSYRDPKTGELAGIEIDLGRAIAREVLGDPDAVVFRVTSLQNRTSLVRSVLGRLVEPFQRLRTILSTAFNTNWWHLGMAGRLPEFLCPAEAIGQQDFVGLDYYWGMDSFRLGKIRGLLEAVQRRYANAPVWAGALYRILRYYARLFPRQEILVIENGCVDEADGVKRVEYLRQHIREVQRARRDGVNVAGYICWSITSNREWGARFEDANDFGLYHIDLDNDAALTREPTEAAEAYREIVRRRGVAE